jgi:hypothetical protein
MVKTSRHIVFHAHYIPIAQKAVIVPQTAMMLAIPNTTLSNVPQRPVRTTLAKMGPIIHNMKAERDPRRAIMELNPGTRMDTPTDSKVNPTRSTAVSTHLSI